MNGGGGLGQSQFGTNWGNFIGADPGASASYGVLNTNTGGLGGAPNSTKGGFNPSALSGLAGALGGGGQAQQQAQPSMGMEGLAGGQAPIYRGNTNFQRRFGQPQISAVQLPMTIMQYLTGG